MMHSCETAGTTWFAPGEGSGRAPGDPARGGVPQVPTDPARVRVLIVDDDASFLDVATRALSAGDPPFDVITAESGAGAIQLLESGAMDPATLPDLVLLDFHLPDATAPGVLRRLAQNDALRAVPILVLTRDAHEGARKDALLAGAKDFAAKPSRVRSLRDIVLRFWESHGPSADDHSD